MKQIKWGILGTGSIAKAFAEALKETDGELLAVASANGQRAIEFCNSYGGTAIEGHMNLISMPDIDAIYIATPHTSHFEFASACLKQKKAVLCEKPMTINATETMALIDLSRKNKTLLMEAFMYKIHPQTQKIFEIVNRRMKGPLSIKAEFCFSVDVPDTHRLVNRDLGGGSILDIGCYPMSISRHAVGALYDKNFVNPIKIQGEGELNHQDIDLNASAELIFEDGSVAKIRSATNLSSESDVTISDGEMTIYVNQPWHCGEFTGRKSQIKIVKANGEEELIDIKTDKGIYALEIDHFAEAFFNEELESTLLPHNDSHGNMIALDQWRRELKVVYDDDRGEKRKVSVISRNDSRDTLLSTKIPGLDKNLSRIVFGCDNQSDTNHAFAMFDHFHLNGGNVFDTAYIYNNGKSDYYLGKWIETRNIRDEIVVLAKGAHTPDCHPKKIRPQLEETLNRMGTTSVDIYCLHRDNTDIPVGDFIDMLNELKNEGLISVFGASNWSLDRFKEANEYALANDKEPFTVLSNNFSLARMNSPVWPGCFSCSDNDYVDYIKENQIAIFPWSSQARGFFLDGQEFTGAAHVADPNREEQDRVWGSEENFERRRRCLELAEKKSVDPIQIALAYVLCQQFPTFPLIGPRNFFETENSMDALNLALDSEEVAWLNLES